MEIWYDGADTAGIARLAQQGWIKGVTTNPRILSTKPIDPQKQIAELLDCQLGPLAVQVTALDQEGIIKQAKRLHELSSRIVVKVPVTTEGLQAIPTLLQLRIPTLATAVFSAEQFLLVATMGVHYIAPYVSHMQRHGMDAMAEIAAMQTLIQHYGFKTKVMVASLPSMQEVMASAKLGVHAATLHPARIYEWFKTHPLTDKFTQAFAECWEPFAKDYDSELL